MQDYARSTRTSSSVEHGQQRCMPDGLKEKPLKQREMSELKDLSQEVGFWKRLESSVTNLANICDYSG